MEEIERDPLNNRKKERETKKESEAYQRFFFFHSFHFMLSFYYARLPRGPMHPPLKCVSQGQISSFCQVDPGPPRKGSVDPVMFQSVY